MLHSPAEKVIGSVWTACRQIPSAPIDMTPVAITEAQRRRAQPPPSVHSGGIAIGRAHSLLILVAVCQGTSTSSVVRPYP